MLFSKKLFGTIQSSEFDTLDCPVLELLGGWGGLPRMPH